MIRGSCHCGSISFEITQKPKWLVDCNCSICRRVGALWAHVDIDSVTITPAQGGTIAYVHGDKMLAIHTCKDCGCTTHWENLKPEEFSLMAVNFRMCEADDAAEYRIRRFDGADTWAFLD
jgi:hypothetical protein